MRFFDFLRGEAMSGPGKGGYFSFSPSKTVFSLPIMWYDGARHGLCLYFGGSGPVRTPEGACGSPQGRPAKEIRDLAISI